MNEEQADLDLLKKAERALSEIDRTQGLIDRHADVLAALRIRIEGGPRKSLEPLVAQIDSSIVTVNQIVELIQESLGPLAALPDPPGGVDPRVLSRSLAERDLPPDQHAPRDRKEPDDRSAARPARVNDRGRGRVSSR
jgi:hypothetical protein